MRDRGPGIQDASRRDDGKMRAEVDFRQIVFFLVETEAYKIPADAKVLVPGEMIDHQSDLIQREGESGETFQFADRKDYRFHFFARILNQFCSKANRYIQISDV